MSDPTRRRCSAASRHTRLERLEIVDGLGRTRLVLGGLGVDSSPGIAIFDQDGHERASLVLYPAGPQLSFVLHGNGVLDLGVADPEDPEVDVAGSYLCISDADGHAVHSWEGGLADW